MTDEELTLKIRSCVAGALELEPDAVGPTTAYTELEQWDSLGHLGVIMSVEEEFGKSIPMDKIPSLTSVPAIFECLRSLGV